MLDSFANRPQVKKANQLKELQLYPFFRSIEETIGSRVKVQGKNQVMIGSNNYLGLTHHPYVKEAAMKAIEKFGTGCTGSRFLNGNLELHEELEVKLAEYIGHEKALVFSTGMQVNLGVISTLGGPKDLLINDNENHASIIDGNRLALGTSFKYKHNDMNSLEEVLSEHRSKYRNAYIIADGVFSMTGDIAKVDQITALAKKYNAGVYIDDAHGFGVLGKHGRGTVDSFNQTSEVDFIMGTFSKSFASIGGFISGSTDAINYIKHTARSFMFSASMPPSAVATVIACLELVQKDPSILKNLWNNVEYMQKGFKDLGFYTYGSNTPIIPIFIGDDLKAMQVTMALHEHGIFATPVISPAVPASEALIRTSYMSIHKKDDLEFVLEVFAKLKQTMQIPTSN